MQRWFNPRLVSKCKTFQSFKLTSRSMCKRLPNFADTTKPAACSETEVDKTKCTHSVDYQVGQGTNDMGRRKRKPYNPNINHPKKMKKFQQDEKHEHIEPYNENGMRKIKPYVYTFETHAKGRWLGKTLMDVFKKEFRMETPLYYKTAIEGGLIRLNGKPVKPDRVIRSQDFLQSRVHRHEPPVSDDPLDIIAETENFIVINKPSSIPIHPAGKYRHNSIVYLMAREHGLKGLHTFYRLDRLTSGVFIFARSLEVAKKIDSQVRGRELHKVYLCKVNGEFPSEPIECSEPIFTVSFKIGVCRVSPEGKPSKTLFQRVSYDGETSIIKCLPHTGRMHQIRVHLQYLGFPILNDPLYTGPVWGPEQGKDGKIPYDNDDEFIKELTRLHSKEQMENQIKDDCEMLVSNLDGDIQLRSPLDITGNLPSNHTPHTTASSEGNKDLISQKEKKEVCSNSRNTVSSMSDEFSRSKHGDSSGTELAAERTSTETDEVCSVSMVTEEDVDIKLSETCTNIGKRSSTLELLKEVGTSSTSDTKRSLNAVESEDRTQKIESIAQVTCYGSDSQSTDNMPGSFGMTKSQSRDNAASSISNPKDNANTESESEDPVTNARLDTETDSNNCNNARNVTGERDGLESNAQTSSSKVEGGNSESSTSEGNVTINAEEEALNKLALELCRECKHPLPDPEPESMVMYLHALTYKGPDFEFSTPIPKWASEHMERTGSKIP